MSEKIPVIDFALFTEGNKLQRSAIAAEIYHACQEIGFMYLKHPGIDSDLVAETFERAQKFFNLPLSEKNKLAWSDEFNNRGYVGVGRERLNDSKPGDLKEAYNIGKEIDPTQLNTTQPSLSCNRWLEGNANHVFCSTKHRVRVPQEQKAKQSRYSIAFFCHPNHDTEISCLETCQSAERPPLYPSITAFDYLLSRLLATY